MRTYMICYDNQNDETDAFGEQMRQWKCVQPSASLWFGSLTNNALAVREILRSLVRANEALFICEIKPSSDWATLQMHSTLSEWVRANIGP
ncbi:hypothetical protein MUO32_06190 [Shinella sp. CPCC 101442]|uniref:hypothetical protein n=1 Tax=Shinella sp. CPCC 101442 TaxID=2932265 RepID=UPI00215205C1|nr:hypothetical protein [Shinella sp. CPCC 101442]MCR6498611.1 hypothetical protein [Shinella sp. CPCC 101442]